MTVYVNSEPREVEPGTTVQGLVAALEAAPEGRGLAVALDGEVVPRAEWSRTEVCEGARVEIVVAVQGG